MNDDNQDIFLERELIELKSQYLALNQELEQLKQLFNQRRITPTQFLLFVKLLLVILIGISAQNDTIQFNGDQLLPIVEKVLHLNNIESF